MLKLKEEVKERIIKAIEKGACRELDEIAEEISSLYANIDGVFNVMGPFYDLIHLPENLVPNAYKCIGGHIELSVEIYGAFDTGDICEDASPEWSSEFDMVVAPLPPSKALDFLRRVMNSKAINWVPVGITGNALKEDKLEEVFDLEKKTGYIVQRPPYASPQASINAWFLARLKKPNAELSFRSRLHEEYDRVDVDRIESLAKELEARYSVPVYVTLRFNAECG